MARREDLRKLAEAHFKAMEECFGSEIKFSIDNSIIYGGSGKTPQKSEDSQNSDKPEMTVLNISSTEAVLRFPDAALLNFASYRHAGGGFITGAWAQEEAICHDSTLYNVLCMFEEFYAENEKKLNNSLYTDRAIFSPKIIFEHDGIGSAECSVITCASPNLSAARGHGITAEQNEAALKQRVDFVISIAEENGCDTVILGAWGCGVFGQDPKLVARLFKERLAASSIKLAVFAIPGNNNNYTSFREMFSR